MPKQKAGALPIGQITSQLKPFISSAKNYLSSTQGQAQIKGLANQTGQFFKDARQYQQQMSQQQPMPQQEQQSIPQQGSGRHRTRRCSSKAKSTGKRCKRRVTGRYRKCALHRN